MRRCGARQLRGSVRGGPALATEARAGHPANNPGVAFTAAPCNYASGTTGVIQCNGDMTTTTPTTGSSVSVSAYGTASEQVYPHMQLLMNGILLGEWDVTGSSQNYTADVSGRKLYYYHSDHLGSSRLLTDANGNVVWQGTLLPYGYEYSPQGSVNNYKFTGFERDAESQLDHAWFRQYAPHMGRWMSPDPAGLAAVDPTNPQTWNRYAYVAGNPANAVDPSGLLNCPAMDDDGKCYYTGDFAKGAGPPLDPWFWQEGFGMASASQMMGIWGYGSSTSGCFGPICFGGDTLPGRLGTIQNVLTGNWGAFFPAIPGYNAAPILDATRAKPDSQRVDACVQQATDAFNTRRTEALARANDTYQNNWAPTPDQVGAGAIGVFLARYPGPYTARMFGAAIALGAAAKATWYAGKSEVQFLNDDLKSAGVLLHQIDLCRSGL